FCFILYSAFSLLYCTVIILFCTVCLVCTITCTLLKCSRNSYSILVYSCKAKFLIFTVMLSCIICQFFLLHILES
ncbi:hypothetical protein LDENG_00004290, partial [Lucifuga dentata]